MKRILFLTYFVVGAVCVKAQLQKDAKTLMYYQRYKSASELLRNLIKTDPGNAESWYLLTSCYLKDNHLKSFWDSFPAVPSNLENSPFIECAKGDVLLSRGKKDSAASLFHMALVQTGEDNPAILLAVAIANIRSDSGNVNYALGLLSKAIKLDKKNPALYVEQGNAEMKLLNGTEAYQAFTKARAINSSYAEAYYRLGELFVTQNNPEMYLICFQQSVGADSTYGPAWYALYYHYYFKDPDKALIYLGKYIGCSDFNPDNNYRKADLLYLSKNYREAIKEANLIVEKNDSSVDAKIFKLLAYSYNELNDSVKALDNMRIYFEKQTDSSLIAKDFESAAKMFEKFPGKEDSAAFYLTGAIKHEKDSAVRIGEYKVLAGLYKKMKKYKEESVWLGKYYLENKNSGNIDLFNWGISAYLAQEYQTSDSVFTIYTDKYPEQTFGFYWKARSDAAIDTAMERGLAIPSYTKLIELSSKDSSGHQNKKWLIEAYAYLAAYEVNIEKNYADAMNNLENVLSLDPEDVNAKKYLEILRRNSAKSPVSKNK
jgi:hypothetical protein